MSDDRESLGRLVHETRLAHEAERAAAEGRATFLLGAWEDRTDHQRELDMRIGSAVAVRAVADAGTDRAALEMCRAKLAAVRRVLAESLTDPGDGRGVLERPADDSAMLDRALRIIARLLAVIGNDEKGREQ
jgi:hypothetical protein